MTIQEGTLNYEWVNLDLNLLCVRIADLMSKLVKCLNGEFLLSFQEQACFV